MGTRRRHTLPAWLWRALAVLVLALLPAAPALAQASLPPAPQAPGDSQEIRSHAIAAALALGKESAALAALHGFGPETFQPLLDAIGPLQLVSGRDTRTLMRQLQAADEAGAREAALLDAAGVTLGPQVTQVLARLSDADLRAAERGTQISIEAGAYLGGLDALVQADGRGTGAGSRPDPAAVTQGLAAALGREVGSVGRGSDGSPVWRPVALGVLTTTIGALVLFWLWRRRQPETVAVQQPARHMQRLLEVSSRLTAATVGQEIDRAIVREALGLVRCQSAALVVRRDGALVIGHESTPGLLVPAGLDRSAIAGVVATGQPIVVVSTGDPAVAVRPAALAAIPLTTGGRVEGVLVVVRPAEQPFGGDDLRALVDLAPIASAALDSARRASVAVQESMVDALTGVGNRRRLDHELGQVLSGSPGQSTALVMLDLDHFKAVNDTYGHPVGDALLRGVATRVRTLLRPSDGVYRYGGEEFCLVLPVTPLAAAHEVAERVRAAIEATPFEVGTDRPLTVTASIGLAVSVGTNAAALVAQADAALYEAKRAGRNSVRVG